jgi:hypothetical protein
MFACGGRKSGNFFILKKSGVENLGGADCPRVALAFDWSDFHYFPLDFLHQPRCSTRFVRFLLI